MKQKALSHMNGERSSTFVPLKSSLPKGGKMGPEISEVHTHTMTSLIAFISDTGEFERLD